MRHLSRKERGLGKHDAPLKIQWMKGYDAFVYGKIRNPYSSDTMLHSCLLYTSPSPRDATLSRMPSSA